MLFFLFMWKIYGNFPAKLSALGVPTSSLQSTHILVQLDCRARDDLTKVLRNHLGTDCFPTMHL